MPAPKTEEGIKLWKERLSKALKGRPSHLKGRHYVMSKEHKRKISEALKGRKCSPEHIENNRIAQTGKKCPWLSEQNRRNFQGKNNPNWKGGKAVRWKGYRTKNRYQLRLWRKAVLLRDDHTCQKCSIKRIKNMVAHHMHGFFQYPKLRYVIDNGITLCKDCHYNFHKIYTTRGNNRKQLKEFLDG